MHQLSPPLSTRITIATLVFVLCCVLSTVRVLIDAPTGLHSADPATSADQRFAALRAALPPQGVVGYVGESGNPAVADYYLAQYALTPLVVDHSSNHPLVVGNFPLSPLSPPSGNLQLVKDFGNGVLLFANKDAQ
jgi:hypothetical protein